MSTIRVVALESQQAEQLKKMFCKGRWTPQELKRASILLMAHNHQHLSNSALAQELSCGRETVRKVRNRFLDEGLKAALFDRPRSGAPRKLNSKEEAYVIATACTNPPQGRSYWTLEMLQQRLAVRQGKQVSHQTVYRVLLRSKTKPWLKKSNGVSLR